MIPSNRTLELIRSFEGLRLKAYQDSVGVWTVGYGQTGPGVTKDTAWTQAQAEAALLAEVLKFTSDLFFHLKVQVTDNQLSALTSFCYNVGVANFAKSTLLKKLNAGDVPGAADEFLKWCKAGGKELPGLVARRAKEREVFLAQ